jgi:phytoene dehydrogenase-like protein
VSDSLPADVVIVGGGLGGLATGALLAPQRRVLLLEREHHVGGRAGWAREEGFLLSDTYQGLLHAGRSPFLTILKRLGRQIPLAETPPETLWRASGGRRHPLPTSPAALLRSQLVPFGTKMGLLGLHTAAMAAKPALLWDVPWEAWLRRQTRDPHAIRLALDNARTLHYSAQPERLSAGHVLETIHAVVAAGLPPSLLPVGGWETLHAAFRATIEEFSGGRIETGVTVDRVEVGEPGGPLRVRSGADVWEAMSVVLAVPPQQIAALLPEETPLGDHLARRATLAPTAGVSVYLGVEGLDPDGVAAIDLPEEGILLGCPTLWDPSLAPRGAHLLTGVRFLTPEEVADPAAVAASHDLLLERLEQQFPGAARGILLRRRAHPVLTAVHHVVGQSRPHLPPVAPPGIPGLYLVGDGVAAPGTLANVAGNAALQAVDAITACRT